MRRKAVQTLDVGDRIVVTGSEHMDPALNVLALLTEVRRVGDDWKWSRPFPVNPPQPCTD